MAGSTSAINYLIGKKTAAPRAVTVLFGGDSYLKKAVLTQLKRTALPDNDSEFSISHIDAEKETWRDVLDILATRSLFGDGKRLVILDDADDFVKKNRNAIEDYTKQIATTAILVVMVNTWPKSTRLYKELEKTGLQIDCSSPKPAELVKWLQHRAIESGDFKLTSEAARAMVDILGCEPGLLDQEIQKMSLTVDPDKPLTPEEIQNRIGGWRAKKVWDMLDAACDGNCADALKQLERLIYAGEHPIAILGQVAFPLRKFALAASIYRFGEQDQKKISLSAALERAGVARYFLAESERRLKRLGRERAVALHRWLLEADLAMKGESSRADRARIVLERLIVRIAVPKTVPLSTTPEMSRLS